MSAMEPVWAERLVGAFRVTPFREHSVTPLLPDVVRLGDGENADLPSLLSRYELHLERVADDSPIPGSYWGDSEAGLIEGVLYARSDTPLHSILHETAHFVCMTPERRRELATDAGGDDAEEDAVCYLQVLLSDYLSRLSRSRLFRDMDAWGYSFRLGSSERWFYEDADDARRWLGDHGLIDVGQKPTWTLRPSISKEATLERGPKAFRAHSPTAR